MIPQLDLPVIQLVYIRDIFCSRLCFSSENKGRHEALGTGFVIGLSVYFRCSGCNEVEEVLFSFFGKERRRLREGE